MAISPRPGIVLAPTRRYAYVVRRSLQDAAREPIGAADVVTSLLKGEVPLGAEALAPLFASLAETLTTLEIPLTDVATASVFTTGDPATELRTLTDALLAAHDVDIVDLAVDPFDGAEHDRLCELQGTVSLPQFQDGLPPFDTGGFIDTLQGVPAKMRDEQAPVVLTLPHAPMPEDGYPVVVFLHGPDGRATDAVDRGVVYAVGGIPKRGHGPARALAAHGFATLGFALPMNVQRLPGTAPGAIVGTVNPTAIRDHFRQAVIEARLVIEAVGQLEIQPATVAACEALPAQEGPYRIDPTRIYVLGDRTGGMVGTLLTAVDPAVQALVTGSAGGDVISLLTRGLSLSEARHLAVERWGLDGLPAIAHPALHIAQWALDAADPIVFAPRIGRQPLEGSNPRALLQAVGNQDGLAPTWVFDRMAVATAHPQAGETVWTSMQNALGIIGLPGSRLYPVVENLAVNGGKPYTSAVVQVDATTPEGAPLPDAGAILTQLESLKFQYVCFFRSHRDAGVAAIVAPRPLDEACPKLSR